jgi:hypothetical protein
LEKSIHKELLSRIIKGKKGKIIFPSDFNDMANTDAVRQALSRLVKDNVLIRLAHGIYLYPKVDAALGILYPSTDDIVQAIAKRDKIRIIPTGINALNKLGLSTQVPMKSVYLTDGKPKTLQAGKRTIIFQTAAPKKFAPKGQISSLVIQALEALGKTGTTPEVIDSITTLLKKEDQKLLKEDAKLAPAWIGQLLISISHKMNSYD